MKKDAPFARLFTIAVFALAFLAAGVIAHDSTGYTVSDFSNEGFSWSDPVSYIYLASVVIILVILYALIRGKRLSNSGKKLCFWIIAFSVVLPTLYLGGHTVYENISSITKGPVHWHADYELWVCEKKLELIKPDSYFKNKVGTPLLHSHRDDRIHIEGVVGNFPEMELGNYFKVIGGELSETNLIYPTAEGAVSVNNGDKCGQETGTLKVYANGKKVENPESYLIYPSSYVPPGDCIIILFDGTNSTTTDRVCTSWQAKDINYTTIKRPEISKGGHTWQ